MDEEILAFYRIRRICQRIQADTQRKRNAPRGSRDWDRTAEACPTSIWLI